MPTASPFLTVTNKEGERIDIRISEIKAIGELRDPKAKAYIQYGDEHSAWVTQTVEEIREIIG